MMMMKSSIIVFYKLTNLRHLNQLVLMLQDRPLAHELVDSDDQLLIVCHLKLMKKLKKYSLNDLIYN